MVTLTDGTVVDDQKKRLGRENVESVLSVVLVFVISTNRGSAWEKKNREQMLYM